jgi:hypothetical protein
MDAIALLRLAVKTGRMPGVTCSLSPGGRYCGARIAHMVSLVHAREGGYYCANRDILKCS